MIGQGGLEEVSVGLTCTRIRQSCEGAAGLQQLLPRVPVTFHTKKFHRKTVTDCIKAENTSVIVH